MSVTSKLIHIMSCCYHETLHAALPHPLPASPPPGRPARCPAPHCRTPRWTPCPTPPWCWTCCTRRAATGEPAAQLLRRGSAPPAGRQGPGFQGRWRLPQAATVALIRTMLAVLCSVRVTCMQSFSQRTLTHIHQTNLLAGCLPATRRAPGHGPLRPWSGCVGRRGAGAGRGHTCYGKDAYAGGHIVLARVAHGRDPCERGHQLYITFWYPFHVRRRPDAGLLFLRGGRPPAAAAAGHG